MPSIEEKFSVGSLKLHDLEKVIGLICSESSCTSSSGSTHPALIFAFEKTCKMLGSCWKSPAIKQGCHQTVKQPGVFGQLRVIGGNGILKLI